MRMRRMETIPLFPSFSFIPGLLSLRVEGFVITENPGDGFKYLERLELDCTLDCDLSYFDGVDCLKLVSCDRVFPRQALEITQNIFISNTLCEEDNFYGASDFDLLIDEEFSTPIHFARYENARSFSLSGTEFSQTTLAMPKKLPDKLKCLHISGLETFVKPLPQNSLRELQLSHLNPSEALLQSLSNVEKVRFFRCESLSLDSLGSGIKDVTLDACSVDDYSPLSRYEKVSILHCRIPHTLKLSEVKELTIQSCEFHIAKESNCSLVPFLSDCPKLEVLDVDFSYFDRYDMIASEFPSLKKIVLRGVDGENVDMDLFSFSFAGFRKCLMPRLSRSGGAIMYLLR